MARWREHDDRDKPTAVVVVLCRPCSKRLIVHHPRLYAEMDQREPHPGTMELCLLCRNRDGVTCPLAKSFGGQGVEILPKPSIMWLDGARSVTGPVACYSSAPKSCSRREVLALVGDLVDVFTR
jgi:hypothetical protein